jgi:hypothetical protein
LLDGAADVVVLLSLAEACGVVAKPGSGVSRRDGPTYLTQRERIENGMRKAGVPEE